MFKLILPYPGYRCKIDRQEGALSVKWTPLKISNIDRLIIVEWVQYGGRYPRQVIAMGQELIAIGGTRVLDKTLTYSVPADKVEQVREIVARHTGTGERVAI